MTERLLITGSTGCSGSYQIQNLLENNRDQFEIHGTVRSTSSLDGVDIRVRDAVIFHYCDLRDSLGVSKLLEEIKPGIILHYAADAFIPPCWDNPALYLHDNPRMVTNILQSTVNIRKEEQRRGAPERYDPVVFLPSSLEVYGTVLATESYYRRITAHGGLIWPPPRGGDGDAFRSEIPIKEDAPLRPLSHYAIGKITMELTARHYHEVYDLKTVVGRCCNQTGPGRKANYAETNFALQIALILNNLLPPVIRHGLISDEREFLDYRDAVKAHLALALQAAESSFPEKYYGIPINICRGTSHAIEYILTYYLQKAEKQGVRIERELDPRRVRPTRLPKLQADNSLLKEITGWEPVFPLEKTLDDIFDYWLRRVADGGERLLPLVHNPF